MALDTVADYVRQARVLLQDTVLEYRYPDADLVDALNMAFLEARRLRVDLFMPNINSIPSFAEADIAAATAVKLDPMYRVAFLYFIVGQTQLRDEEDTQDTRAAAFLSSFSSRMMALSA